jgi:hypothetical protein
VQELADNGTSTVFRYRHEDQAGRGLAQFRRPFAEFVPDPLLSQPRAAVVPALPPTPRLRWAGRGSVSWGFNHPQPPPATDICYSAPRQKTWR